MGGKRDDVTVWHGFMHNLDCHDKPIEILTIADLHIGDPCCDEKQLKEMIDTVKNNPNRYVILGGDLMNTAIKDSKSDSYSEKMKPFEQLLMCAELLSPITDKILAIVPGNHEERITRSVGTDMTKLLAVQLGIDSVYSEDAALVVLKFGHNVYAHSKDAPVIYSIYVNHGNGGGKRAGSKLNSLQDYASIIDADVFIVGHTHFPAVFKQQTFRITPQTGSATLREQLFVNTASDLKYGGYGKRKGYQPASNSYPVITLDNTYNHITATL